MKLIIIEDVHEKASGENPYEEMRSKIFVPPGVELVEINTNGFVSGHDTSEDIAEHCVPDIRYFLEPEGFESRCFVIVDLARTGPRYLYRGDNNVFGKSFIINLARRLPSDLQRMLDTRNIFFVLFTAYPTNMEGDRDITACNITSISDVDDSFILAKAGSWKWGKSDNRTGQILLFDKADGANDFLLLNSTIRQWFEPK
jgi:hypothetical protein